MDSTPAHASSSPKLLDQLRARIRLRHYSIRTEAQYVHWVRRYILFHGKRHPREMGTMEGRGVNPCIAVVDSINRLKSCCNGP
ncbi:phage integrase N-terminal SAM-like domain-containing protein [Undibacterium rugosum]|uniref:phage integrase N-terminal SAM-like domain-containing protein n=1 Tax=Undibacterium rugosum TaxID=2762291 RepID=UPI0039AEB432